jgi:hypothetical protein
LEINDVRNCCLADLLNPGRCFGVDDLAASVFLFGFALANGWPNGIYVG